MTGQVFVFTVPRTLNAKIDHEIEMEKRRLNILHSSQWLDKNDLRSLVCSHIIRHADMGSVKRINYLLWLIYTFWKVFINSLNYKYIKRMINYNYLNMCRLKYFLSINKDEPIA